MPKSSTSGGPKEPGPIDAKIGKHIRSRRTELRMSQQELGDKLEIGPEQVDKYEKGLSRIGAALLQRIATALDVPVTFFYGGGEKAGETESLLLLDSEWGLRLLRAYSSIENQSVRRQLVSLMESIVENQK